MEIAISFRHKNTKEHGNHPRSAKSEGSFGHPSEVLRTSYEKNIYPLYLPVQTFF